MIVPLWQKPPLSLILGNMYLKYIGSWFFSGFDIIWCNEKGGMSEIKQ
jgi:hypothetical protein